MRALWLSSVVLTSGQTAPAGPPMAEQVFKNIQVLKGIPVNEFMGTMGVFSAALGMSCEDCHAAGDADWSVYAKDSPRKQMARVMVTMMATINKTHFRGRQVDLLYVPRGSARPRNTADLAERTARRPASIRTECSSRRPTRLAPKRCSTSSFKRSAARSVPGAQELRRARHERRLWTRERAAPTEIYARPGQRTTIIHTSAGDARPPTTAVRVDCGAVQAGCGVGIERSGDRWPEARRGLGVSQQHPAGADEVASRLPSVIDDREVQVVQGTTAHGATATPPSTWRRASSVVRCATSIRRWGGFLRRPTTRSIARWPA